jgi:hypothetical protein
MFEKKFWLTEKYLKRIKWKIFNKRELKINKRMSKWDKEKKKEKRKLKKNKKRAIRKDELKWRNWKKITNIDMLIIKICMMN